MKAMILAAGRGKRMQPLTDTLPKPLLAVRGKPLIQYHLEKLAALGVEQVVINHAWLGHLLQQQLGDGSQFGLRLCYSAEPPGGLETAGGIIKALPWLGDEPFWVINGDVFTDLDFDNLPRQLEADADAHLLLVANPVHHPQGDFALAQSGLLSTDANASNRLTYSGMGLFHPRLFAAYPAGSEQVLALRSLFEQAIQRQALYGSCIAAAWTDVGTPERLAQLQEPV
ncbi:MurNAc alpha-1-phosphate uridylyltransferase [Pseudidiomarina tainanensis]|uniref:MurNAc alpha-1-phosphate uridylyltransferase n=3 Tax=Idiomarinaceae TaxID=267893 RepID=A0A368UYX0_9GAMM|nr:MULTISPECIES: nucleotidyltransferase family protein [Pseudidiomarina]PWW13371.1 MurNAc alpha-1-phosphate uridylyltransferase [Pseudidiomarina maritima]RBP90838.1 MurNAc alpha-1-phosphate uridylyltransferase [Pseudidiomarina tainanensis]RCW32634.1 MurNAc alpha-1-phosphate uridylyltransferase [Pseudidiomarina tainanensis]